jgi:hypothetical protein
VLDDPLVTDDAQITIAIDTAVDQGKYANDHKRRKGDHHERAFEKA